MTMQANLTNRDATRVPEPFVKWSFEPPRAADVPAAIAQAIHQASLPPRGPAFVSIPMDDWAQDADDEATRQLLARTVTGPAGADPDRVADLAERIDSARNPVMVVGPDVDASGGFEHAVFLAERAMLPVWATPAPGGGRIGFPESHPFFRGTLPPAIGPAGQALAGHDLVLVVGSSVFPYYPYIPGPVLPELVQITSDPHEAARAPAGEAIVAEVARTLAALGDAVTQSERPAPPARDPLAEIEPGEPLQPAAVYATLREALPEDAVVVLESSSSTLAARARLQISTPASFFFAAGGGLGFALAASLGVQLALPQRRVVCVLGEGAAQYAITGLWTAAAYDIPVTFLVLRNGEYGILKWFAQMEQITGAPGLDLPQLDTAAVAAGYGVPSESVTSAEQLRHALGGALAASGPRLVEVAVKPGMSLF